MKKRRQSKNVKFPSKVDMWLAVLIVGTMLLVILEGLRTMFAGGLMSTGERAVLFIVHFAVPCFILWLFSSTYYVIGDKELLIRYGPFRRAVPLDSIITVRKTSNPASSPALSLKRLEISYGNGSIVLISPKDRDAFLTELRRKCPGAFIE
ncbi:hypothetical protein X546_05740 [Brevibacillus borstelensis cifa_chp40]|nr:hypothetical protein X546_05740 [Brevibacillus borstelensis cifa_chp40]